jgi:hypothetical protein
MHSRWGFTSVLAIALPLTACRVRTPERGCFAETGCPAAPRAVSCPSELVWQLEEVLSSADALIDKRIQVLGPLTHSIYSCMGAECPSSTCCNRCVANYVLRLQHSCDPIPGLGSCMLDDSAHTIVIDDLTCAKDDLVNCCPSASEPEPTVVRGTLRRDESGYHLFASSVCHRGR